MKTIFWSSFLERIYVDMPHLDMLFCYINYYLRMGLEHFNEQPVLNKHNQEVKFFFINVAGQFYNANIRTNLARDYEARNNKLVHRHEDAMVELAEKYVCKISEVLMQ